MKIMKLLAACAMVGALATTTAMAEEFLARDEFGVVVYDATNNAVTINLEAKDFTDYATKVSGDFTVLVTNVETGTVSNTQIFQIDQAANLDNDGNDNTLTCVLKLSAAVKADYDAIMNPDAGTETVAEGEESTKPASSTYYVRLGGAEGNYICDTFTFTAPEDEKPEVKPQVVIGNADASTETSPITLNDCTEICKYVNGKIGSIRTNIENGVETVNDIAYAAAAYCDGDNAITLNDCTEICKYVNGKNPTYVGTTVDLGTYDTVK